MVRITEPMTMITDYLIFLQSLYFAVVIFINADGQLSRSLWGYTFIITGLSALLGGTAHGFKEHGGPRIEKIVWKSTVMLIGLSAVLMFSATITSTLTGAGIRSLLNAVAIITYVFYIYWMSRHDEFIYVIIFYLPYMISILVILLFNIAYAGSIQIGIGIIITFIGFGIQASKKSIHKHFNHNDLFHVLQMIAIYFFYLGIIQIRDI